jgi:hypothetical protein
MSAIQLLTALTSMTSHLRRDRLETFLEWLRLECIQMQKIEMATGRCSCRQTRTRISRRITPKPFRVHDRSYSMDQHSRAISTHNAKWVVPSVFYHSHSLVYAGLLDTVLNPFR